LSLALSQIDPSHVRSLLARELTKRVGTLHVAIRSPR
jgi:hypothetical protein